MKTFHALVGGSSLLAVLSCGCVDAIEPARNPLPVHVDRPSNAAVEPDALHGITDAHNRVRARLGLPALRWSPQLAEIAKRWANACVDDDRDGMIDHSRGRGQGEYAPLGENLYATTGPAATPDAAVTGWAGEASSYDPAGNQCRSGEVCGHYTQIVWRDTREVGCGVGSCPKLRYRSTLVCNYAPAGNVIGERPY